jgi:hypothetical protein
LVDNDADVFQKQLAGRVEVVYCFDQDPRHNVFRKIEYSSSEYREGDG